MIGLRFFPLKSADVRGAGTRDEPLRTSAWEASLRGDKEVKNVKIFFKSIMKQSLNSALYQ